MTRDVTPGIDGYDEAQGDEGQITFEEPEVNAQVCYIGKITNIVDLDAWIFDLECGGEGTIWRDRTIVMRTKNPLGIASYNLPNVRGVDVLQLYRCGG